MNMKEKVYLFKVSMRVYPRQEKKLYREMMLKGSSNLYEFAEAITDAYNFDMDHAFSFHYSMEDFHCEYAVCYSSFYDLDCIDTQPNERSVQNTHIHELFEVGKTMYFLYDYGRDWKFIVECRSIIEAELGESYPKVTRKKGKAPPQYDYSGDDESS